MKLLQILPRSRAKHQAQRFDTWIFLFNAAEEFIPTSLQRNIIRSISFHAVALEQRALANGREALRMRLAKSFGDRASALCRRLRDAQRTYPVEQLKDEVGPSSSLTSPGTPPTTYVKCDP